MFSCLFESILRCFDGSFVLIKIAFLLKTGKKELFNIISGLHYKYISVLAKFCFKSYVIQFLISLVVGVELVFILVSLNSTRLVAKKFLIEQYHEKLNRFWERLYQISKNYRFGQKTIAVSFCFNLIDHSSVPGLCFKLLVYYIYNIPP